MQLVVYVEALRYLGREMIFLLIFFPFTIKALEFLYACEMKRKRKLNKSLLSEIVMHCCACDELVVPLVYQRIRVAFSKTN